ncbi:hypothetical protein ACVFZR_03105 [Lacticaseibacillus paracasei]
MPTSFGLPVHIANYTYSIFSNRSLQAWMAAKLGPVDQELDAVRA